MKDHTIGKRIWAISAGDIPIKSTGKEPDFVGQDKLSVLNTSREDTQLEITIYFSNYETVGPFKIMVQSQRVRTFRVNDLIFPHAIPLGVPYGCRIESNTPVVIQFTKLNSAQSELALTGTTAYGE